MTNWFQRRTSRFEKTCECGHGRYECHLDIHFRPGCSQKGCLCTKFQAPSKTGAKRQEHNGRSYHSGKERDYAATLDLLKRAGEVKEWSPQFKVSLDVNGHHITNHYVDFFVTLKDGSQELHEVKGWETDIWKFKRNLMLATYLHDHPEIKYIVIK